MRIPNRAAGESLDSSRAAITATVQAKTDDSAEQYYRGVTREGSTLENHIIIWLSAIIATAGLRPTAGSTTEVREHGLREPSQRYSLLDASHLHLALLPIHNALNEFLK